MKKQELLARLTMEDMKGLTNANLRQLLIQFRDEENMDIKGIWKMNKEELVENLNKIREQQTEEGVKEMNNNIEVKVEENMNLVERNNVEKSIEEKLETLRQILANIDQLPGVKRYESSIKAMLGRKNINVKVLDAMCAKVQEGIVAQPKEVVIKTSRQLLSLFSQIQKNDYVSFPQVVFYSLGAEDPSLKYNVLTASSPKSRITRKSKLEDSIEVPVSSCSTKTITKEDYNPFTKDIAKVHFATTSFIDLVADEGFYLTFEGLDSRIFIASNKKDFKGETFWYNPRTPEDLKTRDELLNLTRYNAKTKTHEKIDVRHYDFLNFSPSDTRIGNGILKDITNGDDRREFLDSLTGNAFTKLMAKFEKVVAEGGDPNLFVLKNMPRLGQLNAGSVVWGKFNNFAMYKENFLTSYTVLVKDKESINYYKNSGKVKFDENEDGSITLKISEATADGTGFVLDTAVARMLSERLGVKVMPSAVRGLFIQARPLLFKGAFLVVSAQMMRKLYMNHNDENMTRYGYIKNQCPELLVDDNIVKAQSDFEDFADCLEFEVLDVARSSSASLSKQMIEKALMKDVKRTTEWLTKYGSTAINVSYYNRFVVKEAQIPTLGEIANPFPTDLIEKIAPTYAKTNGAMYKSMLENQIKSSMKALEKMKFAIDGKNTRLISDHTGLMLKAMSIVKYGEIFSHSAINHFASQRRLASEYEVKAQEYLAQGMTKEAEVLLAEVKKMQRTDNYVVTFKYPTMGIKEYYYAKVLTLEEVKERIAALDIELEEKAILFDYFKTLSDGVTMLPARVHIMRQLAGLDYDFDGWTEIYDYDFVDILATDEFFVVDCE